MLNPISRYLFLHPGFILHSQKASFINTGSWGFLKWSDTNSETSNPTFLDPFTIFRAVLPPKIRQCSLNLQTAATLHRTMISSWVDLALTRLASCQIRYFGVSSLHSGLRGPSKTGKHLATSQNRETCRSPPKQHKTEPCLHCLHRRRNQFDENRVVSWTLTMLDAALLL